MIQFIQLIGLPNSLFHSFPYLYPIQLKPFKINNSTQNTNPDNQESSDKEIQRIVDFIKAVQDHHNPRRPLEETEFIYCLAGNIVPAHYYGVEKVIRRGTKHFLANAKVYVFPGIYSNYYSSARVIGLSRKNKKLRMVRMNGSLITNWRLQKVYNKTIIEKMFYNDGWRDTDIDRDQIISMLEWLPEITEKNLPSGEI